MRAAALSQILDKRDQARKHFMDVLSMGKAVPASYKENALLQAAGGQFENDDSESPQGRAIAMGRVGATARDASGSGKWVLEKSGQGPGTPDGYGKLHGSCRVRPNGLR